MSQVWSQNMRETIRKKLMKPRGKAYACCGLIAKNVEGGLDSPPPPPGLIRVKFIYSLVYALILSIYKYLFINFMCWLLNIFLSLFSNLITDFVISTPPPKKKRTGEVHVFLCFVILILFFICYIWNTSKMCMNLIDAVIIECCDTKWNSFIIPK